MLAGGIGISARLFYLQIVKGGYYTALAQGQHTDFVDSSPIRGKIFFQDKFSTGSENPGLSLAATNKDGYLFYIDTKNIGDPNAAAEKISPILAEFYLYRDPRYSPYRAAQESATSSLLSDAIKSPPSAEGIGENLKKIFEDSENASVKKIADRIDETAVEELKELKISGMDIRKEKYRYYPSDSVAANLLGFVGFSGNDRVGQYGVEGFYNDHLSGSEKTERVSVLPGALHEEKISSGGDIVLTVDHNIQYMLEKKIMETKERLQAVNASAVVMDPKTGAILALASFDSFDPNYYSDAKNIDAYLNDAVQRVFEPGSTFKPFTIAAGIDQGVITPGTTYEDSGAVRIGEYTIRNFDLQSHGVQTMTNVLELSLNTGVVFVEGKLGHDKFREYAKKFGFDERTGVDLQGESGGNIKNIVETNRDINFATASFGQGIAVTPMQIVKAYSAIANGGNMMKPYVVKEIVYQDGTKDAAVPEVAGNPISAKTAAQVTSMMVSVVESGFDRKGGVRGYKVAAKTGTAQIPNQNGPGYSDETIHTFVGFAPAYDPRFLMLIKMDKPKGIRFASDSLAPTFSKLAEYILTYLEVPPDAMGE